MRVLVIVPEMYSYGGTGRFLERLLQLHSLYGIDTALLIPEHNRNQSVLDLAERYGIPVIFAINNNRKSTRPLFTPCNDFLFSLPTVLTWHPDLIVVSTGDPGRMSVTLYFPIPTLYILHTVPECTFRILPRLYLRIGSFLNSLIMTVSNSAAESITQNMGIPRSKIEVVYNSCRTIEPRLCPDASIVLTAGHLESYKNPDMWLRVAQRVIQSCTDITFVWMGDGTLLEPYRKRVHDLALSDRILLLGYIPDPSVWYEKAQVYFQPSLRESHGIAVLEAMSYGIPCVVADTGGLPESVVDGETGYVCSSVDSACFSRRITELLCDDSLRDRMGAAARQRTERCFSEEEQEKKIMELYDRLTGRKCRR